MYRTALVCDYAVVSLGVRPPCPFMVRSLEVTWPAEILTYRGAVGGIEDHTGETMKNLDIVAEHPSAAVVTREWADLAIP